MRQKPKILPPVYFVLTVVIMIALHYTVPIKTLLRDGSVGMGWILVVFGTLTLVGSAGLFRRAGTPVRPFETSTALVTGGFFKFTRNPMYLGMVLALIGVALLLGSLAAFLPIPVFAWWIQSRFIRQEETFLEETFGDAYREYRAKVRRWI
jgi:protein-S-isoprenylcysteine O-methyltransferase Ste14